MYKKLLVIAFVFIACIDFDIDAPYDDINGIYLEHIKDYWAPGKKIIVENEKGYILNVDCVACYDFTDLDRIDTINVYQSFPTKVDFDIADGYAYILNPYYLEIVDFNQTTPQLAGYLPIPGILHSIILSDNYAFVTGNTRIFAIDVSDVENPIQITEYEFNDSIINAEIVPDTLYILLQSGILQIIDIAVPTSPQLIAEHDISDSLVQAYYFVKYSQYLYVTRGYGINTYEIQEDGDLEYLNTLSFSHSITFLETFGSYGICLYDGVGWNRLYLLNLTYPSRPCIGEYLDVIGNPRYAVIDNEYIFLLAYGLDIIEIKEIE